MDLSKFTAPAGRLVRIPEPLHWAFVPDPLPPSWECPKSLWPLVAEARASLGTLNGIGQTLPNPDLLCTPMQRREALTSSSLEGTHVTPRELMLFELNPSEPVSPSSPASDWKEVANYIDALRYGIDELRLLPFCNRLMKDMHRILMRGVRGANSSPGAFRRQQNQIGSNGRYVPPPVADAERLMANLEDTINREDSAQDPLVRCFIAHYQFEAIHPFVDGNGRIGRLLLALMIYKWLGHAMPWLYMSAFFERFKEEYVELMFNISSRGEWEPWIEYCMRGVIYQAKDSIDRCMRLRELKDNLLKKADASWNNRTIRIIESLFSAPLVTIPEISRRFDVQYTTAKKDIEKLVQAGILWEFENHKPKAFYSKEILRIAFDEGVNDEA